MRNVYERNYFIWLVVGGVSRAWRFTFSTHSLDFIFFPCTYVLLPILLLLLSLVVLFSTMYVCQELANFGCFRKDPPPLSFLLHLTAKNISLSRHTFWVVHGLFLVHALWTLWSRGDKHFPREIKEENYKRGGLFSPFFLSFFKIKNRRLKRRERKRFLLKFFKSYFPFGHHKTDSMSK